jgi:hypothetical protein
MDRCADIEAAQQHLISARQQLNILSLQVVVAVVAVILVQTETAAVVEQVAT